MNRATVVYLVMLALSAVGLYAILAMGKTLQAPDDLAGKWQLSSAIATTQPAVSQMTVEQSGDFFQISIGSEPNFSLRMIKPVRNREDGNITTKVALVGEPRRMSFEGTANSDEMIVTFTSPDRSGVWNAKRIVRTFPVDQTAGRKGGGH